MRHKILTDYRDDGIVEVAIDVTDSPLGDFNHSAYMQFHGAVIVVPFSGDRQARLDERGLTILDGGGDVIGHYPHDDHDRRES